MDITEFWTICSANGIILDIGQLKQIERYHNELIYWNSKVNLISRQDEKNLLDKHILHSLSVLKYIDLKPKARCLDIGTGGGLPGIPLKIAKPEIHMLLIDSIAKKLKLAEMFAKHTGLNNIHALRLRAEDLSYLKEYNKYFDFIFSRAVGKLSTIVAWSKKLLKDGGKIVLYKGGDLSSEINTTLNTFSDIEIKEFNISLFGADLFANDDKKIVICSIKK